MAVYYNEIDAYAAQWLRNLIAANQIAPGDVDERSIEFVSPADLAGYTQCHFFAGIGGWSLALRRAGWPDDRQIWTGSCPCQPFSAAGSRRGTDDERHLWPHFRRLITLGRPPVVSGEQVASPLGRTWLAGVRSDLEALGYRVGAADLCSASVGAPHIRQRLYWVADTEGARSRAGLRDCEPGEQRRNEPGDGGGACGLCIALPARLQAPECETLLGAGGGQEGGAVGQPGGTPMRVDDAPAPRLTRDGECGSDLAPREYSRLQEPAGRSSPLHGASWARFNVVHCRDGKARRFEPESFPLAHGVSGRVGRLRGYGNAITPQVAEEFMRAYMEAAPCAGGCANLADEAVDWSEQ